MYRLVVRSNVVVAMRKVCSVLERLGLERELNAAGRQAYADLSNRTSEKATAGGKKDGSERASRAVKEDAAIFLANHEGMRALWQPSGCVVLIPVGAWVMSSIGGFLRTHLVLVITKVAGSM